MRLKGAVVVITGASSGIGAATAIAFAKRGARLELGARRMERLNAIAEKCRDAGSPDVNVRHLDVGRPGEAHSLIADFAGADVGGPGWFQWGVERVDEPGIVGDLGVNLLDDGKQAEIGYTIAPAFQGRGYGTEAIARMVDHLLLDRRLHRVSAECDTRNEASVRLLERLGFRREGHRRSSTWSKGEWSDDYLYAVLSDEWPRR